MAVLRGAARVSPKSAPHKASLHICHRATRTILIIDNLSEVNRVNASPAAHV